MKGSGVPEDIGGPIPLKGMIVSHQATIASLSALLDPKAW